MITFMPWITREYVKAHPDQIFVFGDNAERVGMGGQAKSMRGEPNSFGVATKRKPTMDPESFFSDDSREDWDTVKADMDKLAFFHMQGKTIVIPSDGLGTGLSMLDVKAPNIYTYLYTIISVFYGEEIPWPKPNEPILIRK